MHTHIKQAWLVRLDDICQCTHHTCLEDNFMHVVQITEILHHVAMVTIHVQNSRGGVATLGH